MLAEIKKWLAKRRIKTAAWESAWANAALYGTDGRTNFQRLALAALTPLFETLKLESKSGEVGPYLVGPLPGTELTIYLYVDEAQVHGKLRGFVREKWDYDTPAEFVTGLISFVEAHRLKTFP